MTVLHFIQGIGGDTVAASFFRDLAAGFAADGGEVCVLTVSPQKEEPEDTAGMKVWRLKGSASHAGHDRRTMEQAVGEIHPDIIHIHSMWSYAAREVYRFAKSRRIPFVVSTYKELMEWNIRHRYLTRKMPAELLFQRAMLSDAAALHLVSEQERQRMKNASQSDGGSLPMGEKCCVIPRDRKTLGQNDAPQMMRKLYRKVADSHPFMLMTEGERKAENLLLAYGVSLTATEGDTSRIFITAEQARECLDTLSEEGWRRIQLHSQAQGVLQPVVKAMKALQPERQTIDTEAVEKFGKPKELAFLETARSSIRVARTRQMCEEYHHYAVEKKICIMTLNLKHLLDTGKLSRRNMADFYTALRFERYNEYKLGEMLREVDAEKFFRRALAIMRRSMLLEEGFTAMQPLDDGKTKSTETKIFNSDIQ